MKLHFAANLPNGARVVVERSGVILAYNNCGNKDEWVTWTWDGRDLRSTCHGHYFREFVKAGEDFAERVIRREREHG